MSGTENRRGAEIGAELSCDRILRGRLALWQPRVGYRFAVDPLLLVHFVLEGSAGLGRVCDLGAGVGIIALALALGDPRAELVAVELQPRLAELARRNAAENGLDARVQVVEIDMAAAAARQVLPGASFDRVVANPPYRQLGRGGASADEEAAIARHELRLTVAELAREMRRLLIPGGLAAVVYPAERLAELCAALVGEGLTPARLRLVHPRAVEPAGRVLLEAVKGGRGGLVVEPPFILRQAGGEYTEEARQALGDDASVAADAAEAEGKP